MSPQDPQPLKTTLSDLFVLLQRREDPDGGRPVRFRDGDNSTANYQLSRIPELPQIRNLAERLGLCRAGEFSAATAGVIANQLCVDGHLGRKPMEQRQAFSTPLSAIVHFLEHRLASAPQQSVPTRVRARLKRPRKVEARDQWIYKQCCAGVAYKQIVAELSRRSLSKGWRRITSKQGIQSAALRYAKCHQADLPPSRQNL